MNLLKELKEFNLVRLGFLRYFNKFWLNILKNMDFLQIHTLIKKYYATIAISNRISFLSAFFI